MDLRLKIVFLLALATANCGVLPALKILEGPSSKTTLIGPDGSKISAFAPGGKIVLDENTGPLLQGAPEVVAVAGVAQPPPVIQKQVVEEVAVVTEIKPNVEVVPVESSSTPEAVPEENTAGKGEVVEVSRSAATPNDVEAHIEATTKTVPGSTEEQSTEAESAAPELVESSTDSPTVEKLTENPFSVIPLIHDISPVAVRAIEPQPVVAYVHDSPLYVPQYSEFDGHYQPENLFEEEILGW